MGGERPTGRGVKEKVEMPEGVEIHGKSLRISFTWRLNRYRETLSLPVTKANIKFAVRKREAVLHDIGLGTFDYARHFPDSKHAKNVSRTRDERLKVLVARYKPLKAVDITHETERRYGLALDICIDLLGPERYASILLSEDIQRLRVDLLAGRQLTTVNHYLAALAGFLAWCEKNEYCRPGLAEECSRFEVSDRTPDPLNYSEYELVKTKGCLHPADGASVTLAVYSGLRPGELCGVAREDIDLESGKLEVRRSITNSGTFKVPKTGKARTILLLPPALEACRILLDIPSPAPQHEVTVQINRHESRVDTVTPLISPLLQAKRKKVNPWFRPTSWNSKWHNIQRRAGIRPRRPYQTRHTYACWCLTAHGNLAFIAKQMGHKDFTMLVKVYAAWMDDESPSELNRIWTGMQNIHKIAPMLPHKLETVSVTT
ncbi:integrase [Pseudomonas citronellolis]|uniref:Integrase n=1 Tax=Pseudomonas citronellolis TaxID=53408 RepID=A0A1A9KGU8_9PSED|nr:site-specific integrase [Pseudomonas citronellolis]ANI16807.1 integrase [Pseudomonas citronellolis]